MLLSDAQNLVMGLRKFCSTHQSRGRSRGQRRAPSEQAAAADQSPAGVASWPACVQPCLPSANLPAQNSTRTSGHLPPPHDMHPKACSKCHRQCMHCRHVGLFTAQQLQEWRLEVGVGADLFSGVVADGAVRNPNAAAAGSWDAGVLAGGCGCGSAGHPPRCGTAGTTRAILQDQKSHQQHIKAEFDMSLTS